MARLFYALWPDEACPAALGAASQRLLACGRGRFVPVRNRHLTLHFLGEMGRVSVAEACLEALDAAPFSLTIAGLGRFERREGDIFWAGVAPCPQLAALQAALVEAVGKAGFPVEKRVYTPHITLARRGRVNESVKPGDWEDLLLLCAMEVREICLLESVRDGEGQLFYHTVGRRAL